jgi:histidinol-phosphate/aromatic aminotransferase/cobyric acid decarboxylase-like protein
MITETMIPPPAAHGGDGARLAHALGISPDAVLDLSASLNPCAPDVTTFVARQASAVRSYPDASRATAALAQAIGVPDDRLVLTNGGAEAIALVAAERPDGRVDDPDFSLYARHLSRLDPAAPRWRSNPHNPTGVLAGADERAGVWDEAFYPLAAGRWTRGEYGAAVVVGSLTKVFACPGLRLGYVIAPTTELADALRRRQPEWSVNALACAVLPELLEQADLERWANEVARLRTELVRVLVDAGLAPDPSDANFVLVRDARGVRDRLARQAVLVRDTSSFGLPGGVRIAVPDAQGLERLAVALRGHAR